MLHIPSIKRPKKGSRAFWPRKRARRIYARVRSYTSGKDPKPLGFAGYKAGMTHAMLVETNTNKRYKGQVVSRAVTIIDCPPLSVLGFAAYTVSNTSLKTLSHVFSEKFNKNVSRKIKVPKKSKLLQDSIKKIEESKDKIRSIRLLVHTNPGFKKTPEIFELPLGGPVGEQLSKAKELLGKEIKFSDVFSTGDYLDVFAVTKGKGTQGPVKRFGIKILGRKDEQGHRHVGALGTKEPGKIRSTVPRSGQTGFQTRMDWNKRVLKVGGPELLPKDGLIGYGKTSGDVVLLDGSVPGPAKRLLRFRNSLRSPSSRFPVEIKKIATE